ncbi:MAG: undecaprenyldiphospho-muramoylpentapeptide beta-N-acetylglucosaminyltransferase [bacterium]|nr:undecaprenyldiphospho-muramoylpentapeptide beta-N-acetylglucosaminyltransferase [bacterium]
MRVIISAGGTGGHIYPALAIINKIKEKEPDSKFLYIGTHNRMEKDIIPKYNIPFENIEIYGFNRKKIFSNFKTLKYLIKAKKKCKKLINEFRPDIVIGVGGYVTYPVISVASKLGIKTFIHEQNSVAGLSNISLSKKVDLIGVSFKSSLSSFPKGKTIFTGNPCGEDAIKKEKISKQEYGLSKEKKLVIIVMGSLGSLNVNNYLKNIIPSFKSKNYEVLFITGKNYYDELKNIKHSNNVKIVPYVESLAGLFKSTDLLVTRAGASTISEIISLNIPSILIPSPYVPNNHQYKNAKDLLDSSSAILIEEKDLDKNILVDTIDNLINDEKKLNEIKNNLNKLKVDNSATVIYENIKKLIDRK